MSRVSGDESRGTETTRGNHASSKLNEDESRGTMKLHEIITQALNLMKTNLVGL